MIKDIIDKNNSVTPGSNELEILREHFPACFKEDGSFDIVRFQEYLKDKVEVTDEGYELRFLGKNYARMLASLDTTTVIMPDEAHNSLPENKGSKNIYISGDNLDALKHLLKSYAGQVKCIYIDPPYNTGSDGFVYNDSFNFTAEELSTKLSISLDKAQRILDLTLRGSASHSAWLMFMLPRLLLARDILSKDGIIFISIDDNEQGNLKLLCDDVFGEENLVGQIIWKNATDNNPTNIAVEHEYIVCYCKNRASLSPIWKSKDSEIKDLLLRKGRELVQSYSGEDLQQIWKAWYRDHKSQLGPFEDYKFIDENGIYTGSRSVHNPGKEGYHYDIIHPVTGKPCAEPLRGYRFPETSMQRLIENGKIIFGEDETKLVEIKVYADEYEDKFSSVYNFDGRSGANELRDLFPNITQIFKNPKCTTLIMHLLSFVDLQGGYFLDFFGGSSTSADAILRINQKGDSDNKYIIVQAEEACNEDSEAFKAGYQTIDAIGIDRIRCAAKKIAAENPLFHGDLGFRHFMLKEPSRVALEKIINFDKHTAFGDNTLMDEFGVPTILTTWLERDGYGLTSDYHSLDLGGYTAYYIDKHLYLINHDLTDDAVAILLDKYQTEASFNPQNVVIYGYSFGWNELQSLKDSLQTVQAGEKNLRINFEIRY